MILFARILTPEEFGLIAMLTIFIAISQQFIDGGFSSALIRKKNVSYIDECTIFYFNIFTSLIFYIILNLVAPVIASFYNQKILSQLIEILSISIVFNSVGMIQRTLFKKKLDYKSISKVSIVSTFLSGLFGIYFAFEGYGVWSLVYYVIAEKLFRSLFFFYVSDWRPSITFSFKSLRSMLGYGSKLMFAGLLDVLFNNIYLLIIGKFFSVTDLGYYSRARSIQQLPAENLSGVINRVTFPLFSHLQNDNDRLKINLQKSIQNIGLINFPIMVGLSVISEPLIITLLTDKWLSSATYLQLLCGVGFCYPINMINLNFIKSMGASDLFLKLESLKKILVIISLVITIPFGINTMIIGQFIVHLMSLTWNCYYAGKKLGYGLIDQLKDLAPTAILSIAMGLVIYQFKNLYFLNMLSLLTSQILFGSFFYGFLCYFLKVPSFLNLYHIIKKSEINAL